MAQPVERSGAQRLVRVALDAALPPDGRDRLPRRFAQLVLGLTLFGIGNSLLVLGRLGLDPWDVFHQGLSLHTGIPIGTWSILVGIAVLALWFPLHQRFGLGTLLNAVWIGAVMDVILARSTPPGTLWVRVVCTAGGIFLTGVATGAYIGAGLGPGPRDGVMMGLAKRGWSIRVARTSLELSVLAVGWLLGGNVGFGTLAYALGIGPLAHVFIPRFTVRPLAEFGGTGHPGAKAMQERTDALPR